jgi:hypothetical protein
MNEVHNPKYLATTEGPIHASVAISLSEGSTIRLILESDCPIDWYGDWDNPRPQIGVLFPQMIAYTENSGWVTIRSRAVEIKQIMSSNEGKQLEVILAVHPDNNGTSISNIYKLLALNLDAGNSHYLKYGISSYTAAPLPSVPVTISDVEIQDVKIHSYRPHYDTEGKVAPNLIDATFSWTTNKPCYFWLTVEPVGFDFPKSGAGTGIEPFDVSHPLAQSLQVVQHSQDILLRPGTLHKYELTVWDTEKKSARREGTFRAEGVSSPQPVSSIDEIFLSRWGHTYYNNAPRVSYQYLAVQNLLAQIASQIPWLSYYKAGVFDCSEMTAYLEYVLERHGFTAEIAHGIVKGVGFHAWVLVYNNAADCWIPIEATSPTGVLDASVMVLFQIITGGSTIDYLHPTSRDANIYDVKPMSEFDWWNSPYADRLEEASDKAKLPEPLPPLPKIEYPDLPPLPPVKLP